MFMSSGLYSSPVLGFCASRTCAYSLYCMASAASISRLRNATMSKFCVTCWYCVVLSPPFSRPGVSPQFLLRPTVTSYSLPKPHAPTFLPASLQMSSSPVSLGHGQGAGALEDLGDVDEVGAGLAGLEDLRHPG